MPLGIVSEQEFESALNTAGIKSNRSVELVIDIPDKGRIDKDGNGKDGTPPSVRALIASEALAGANPAELSEAFNISKSSISAYKNGATSTSSYHNPSQQLVKSLEITRQNIIGPAQARLLQAIEAITPAKLEETAVNKASAVARDMSQIIKNMTPDAQQVVQNQVVIFKPRMKEEDEYEVIQVSE